MSVLLKSYLGKYFLKTRIMSLSRLYDLRYESKDKKILNEINSIFLSNISSIKAF